jgi:hypothetical protein
MASMRVSRNTGRATPRRSSRPGLGDDAGDRRVARRRGAGPANAERSPVAPEAAPWLRARLGVGSRRRATTRTGWRYRVEGGQRLQRGRGSPRAAPPVASRRPGSHQGFQRLGQPRHGHHLDTVTTNRVPRGRGTPAPSKRPLRNRRRGRAARAPRRRAPGACAMRRAVHRCRRRRARAARSGPPRTPAA